jgi:hypothetical protein
VASSTPSHSEHAQGLRGGRPNFIRVECPKNFLLFAGLESLRTSFAVCFRTNSKALTDRGALMGLNLTTLAPKMNGGGQRYGNKGAFQP